MSHLLVRSNKKKPIMIKSLQWKLGSQALSSDKKHQQLLNYSKTARMKNFWSQKVSVSSALSWTELVRVTSTSCLLSCARSSPKWWARTSKKSRHTTRPMHATLSCLLSLSNSKWISCSLLTAFSSQLYIACAEQLSSQKCFSASGVPLKTTISQWLLVRAMLRSKTLQWWGSRT